MNNPFRPLPFSNPVRLVGNIPMVPTDILKRIFKDRKPPGFRIMLLLANLLTVAPATAVEDIPSSAELSGIEVTFPQESRFIGISGSFD